MSEISPENIVMITRAGSYIYNLCTPESDIDYIIIYKETTKVPILHCKTGIIWNMFLTQQM